MERFDIKIRVRPDREIISGLVRRLRAAIPGFDAVIVQDQVEDEGGGVVSTEVRELLAELAQCHPKTVFLADSRNRIGEFQNLMIKPNLREAQCAVRLPQATLSEISQGLFRLTGKPLFLTLADNGIGAFDGTELRRFPPIPSPSLIDVVGAGDSVDAAVASALAAGASVWEAAQLGNLAAAVTIRKIGTTGTASPSEVLEMAQRNRDLVESWAV